MSSRKNHDWTAHPRVDVEYKKAPREKNEMTKTAFWDACVEEDRVVLRQFAEVFNAKWEGEE